MDQPVSTLLLSESTMAFGRTLVSDNDGNYKGPLMFSLKEGYVLTFFDLFYTFGIHGSNSKRLSSWHLAFLIADDK